MSDKENVEQKPKLNPKEDLNVFLGLSITLTLFFSIIFFSFMLGFFELHWILSVILTLIYIYCHPYIGKGFFIVAHAISKKIDSTFELTGKDSWAIESENKALLFAATWPIIAIPYILFCTIGVVLGNIFKNLFITK